MSARRPKKNVPSGLENASPLPGVGHRRPVTVSAAQPGIRALDLLIRPTRAEVNLDALRSNFEAVKQAAGGAQLLAVVKANAYGHGGVTVAKALEAWGVDMLGVALVEEAIELRHVGVRAPILVLGGNYEGGYSHIVEYDLVPSVFRRDHYEKLSKAAEEAGKSVKIHLKIDTGMGRLGVYWEEVDEFLEATQQFHGIKLDGILTQLATADVQDSPLMQSQMNRFLSALTSVRQHGHNPRFRHLSNSAAVSKFFHPEINLVRPGLVLYGLAPAPWFSEQTKLRPVLSWKTGVTRVQRLPQGATVSYGATWTAHRNSIIATLPVGYADGYRRSYSNRADVLVRGQRARVVGRVCMDMTMVDVTDIPGVQVGDEVVLIGEQLGNLISADELATLADTISYEVVCGIGARVARRVISKD